MKSRTFSEAYFTSRTCRDIVDKDPSLIDVGISLTRSTCSDRSISNIAYETRRFNGIEKCAQLIDSALRDDSLKYSRSLASTTHDPHFIDASQATQHRIVPAVKAKHKTDLLPMNAVPRGSLFYHDRTAYYPDKKDALVGKMSQVQLLSHHQIINRCRKNNATSRYGISRRRIPQHDYQSLSHDTSVRSSGNLSFVVKEAPTPRQQHNRISAHQLLEASISLYQKELLTYDTRLVELGALIRAIEDRRNARPGIPTVFHLHREFRRVAALHSDCDMISLKQANQVLADTFPWLDKESIRRLVFSFDVSRSGFVKSILFLVPCIVYLSPSCADIVSFAEKDLHGLPYSSLGLLLGTVYDLYVAKDRDAEEPVVGSKYAESDINRSFFKPHISGVRSEDQPHSLFNIVKGSQTNGMRVDEVYEALCCCCLNGTDVKSIQSMVYDALSSNRSKINGNNHLHKDVFLSVITSSNDLLETLTTQFTRYRAFYTSLHSAWVDAARRAYHQGSGQVRLTTFVLRQEAARIDRVEKLTMAYLFDL